MTDEQYREYIGMLDSFNEITERLKRRWENGEDKQAACMAMIQQWHFYREDVERLLGEIAERHRRR